MISIPTAQKVKYRIRSKTYRNPRRLSLNHRSLEENVFVDKAKIVVQFGDRAGENPLTGSMLLLGLGLSLLLVWRGLLLKHHLGLGRGLTLLN